MRKRKLIKIVLWTAGLLFVVIITANIILKSVIEKKIRASLQQFQPFITAGFSKAHINLFAASVSLDSLNIIYNPELKQLHQHKIYFSAASIIGIHFFKLIKYKDFYAGSLQLKNANITFDKYLLDKNYRIPTGLLQRIDMPFKNIFFAEVEIQDAKIFQQDDNKTTSICNGGISLSDVQLPPFDSSFSKDSIHLKNLICSFNKIINVLFIINKVL